MQLAVRQDTLSIFHKPYQLAYLVQEAGILRKLGDFLGCLAGQGFVLTGIGTGQLFKMGIALPKGGLGSSAALGRNGPCRIGDDGGGQAGD